MECGDDAFSPLRSLQVPRSRPARVAGAAERCAGLRRWRVVRNRVTPCAVGQSSQPALPWFSQFSEQHADFDGYGDIEFADNVEVRSGVF